MNHPMAERYSIHITAYATEGRCYSSCWNNNDLIKSVASDITASTKFIMIYVRKKTQSNSATYYKTIKDLNQLKI